VRGALGRAAKTRPECGYLVISISCNVKPTFEPSLKAKGFPDHCQPVESCATPPHEAMCLGRHNDIDQTPCRSGSGARSAELHEQFLACETLHRRDLLEARQQPFERRHIARSSLMRAKLRWRIERDYQELKQEVGLGHYEGRGRRGFHHHAPLCIAAYGFLISEREMIPPLKTLFRRAAPATCPSRRLPTPRILPYALSVTSQTLSPLCADGSSTLSLVSCRVARATAETQAGQSSHRPS
jgi:hypothetical protein